MLEVKFIENKLKKFNVIHAFDMLNAKIVSDKNGAFKKYQNDIKTQFEKNYESLLKYSYIDFSNDYNLMGGMTKRNDKDMAIALEMEKGGAY